MVKIFHLMQDSILQLSSLFGLTGERRELKWCGTKGLMYGLGGSVLNFKGREGEQKSKSEGIVAFNVIQIKWPWVNGYNIWWVTLV